MLALAAHPLGLQVSALAERPREPVAQVVGDCTVGSLSSPVVLRKFLAELGFVTFESEFVDTHLVRQNLSPKTHVFPNLDSLSVIQDRLTQKQLLDKYRIPTSPWLPVNDLVDLKKARASFSKGFVLKQRRFGYDGYGTFVYKPTSPLDPMQLSQSTSGFIAEELVGFKRELATSFVRSVTGEWRTLPIVESQQVNSRCFSVLGPISHRGTRAIERSFRRLLQDLDYVGILAVEMFDTKGRLLVNELAPRVHNSAHYSQDALTCGQFEYHLRAGLGLPLPKVKLVAPAFAMVNLLGAGGKKIDLVANSLGHLHWYGKSENRLGRKLGHITVLGGTAKGALKQALMWQKEFYL